MTDKAPKPVPDDETPRAGESFLSRFHRRKTQARLAETQGSAVNAGSTADETKVTAVTSVETGTQPAEEPTDADMPPLESLDSDSDYTGFFSPRVSDTLRRAALRKLFHGAEFNVIDPLDDYAEDFTTFTALGDIVTADMRHLLEVAARKQVEALEQATPEEGGGPPAEIPPAGNPEPDGPVQTIAASQMPSDVEAAATPLPEKT